MHTSLSSRVIGYLASLVLTAVALSMIGSPSFFHLSNQWASTTIFLFALLQSVVQSIFFLNILSEKGPRWNLVVYASTISIILIIIVFSIWIMNKLNYNMMP
jgi:cytochrome o ubiquinol oxidase subunit IV